MLRFTIIFCIFAIVRAEENEIKIDNELISNSTEIVDPHDFYDGPKMCHTAECYKAASDLRQNMNQSANPCENFYEYACGGFAASNPLPPRELSWGTFKKMTRKVNNQLLNLITEPIEPTDIMPVKKVKMFYASCLDHSSLALRGWKPIKSFLAQSGGWPLIMEPDEWNIEKVTWQKINQFYSRLMFMSPFYRLRVIRDPRESNSSTEPPVDKKVIQIQAPIIPLHRLAFVTGKIFNKRARDMYEDGTYANFTLHIAKILARSRNANISAHQMTKDVDNMIQLEKKFLSIFNVTKEVPQYATIDELQELYNNESTSQDKPIIDWKKIVTQHFAEANVQLEGNEIFQIANSKLLKVLSDILANTDHRVIANYMQWVFVSQMLPYTTYNMQHVRNDLFKDKEGISQPRQRWQDCLNSLGMYHVMAHMYVKKYFNDDVNKEVEKMFLNIQKEMEKHILETDWLTEEIKNVELEKINKMKALISSSEWYRNEKNLINLYRRVVIGNQYMENIVSLKHFYEKLYLHLLKTPFTKDNYAYPLSVYAFYRRKQNSISVSLPALQAPLFSLLQTKTLNYGELGALIGHEMSHGFDNYGIAYDYDGKKYSWSEDTKNTFDGRVQCFAEQYKNFYANDKSKQYESEQRNLLPENLADSLGLDIAFGAFQQIEKQKQSLRLPGFRHWSNEKVFFLSFAKLWCTNISPAEEKHLEGRHQHSNPDFRVNGPLQNSKHFAKIFNCPEDSPMNPNLKCKLW